VRDGLFLAPIAVLWLAWVAYWWIASRHAKATARSESMRSRLAHTMPLLIGGLLMALPRLPVPWLYARFLPRTYVVYGLGVAALAAGLGVAVWARIHLGGNWSSVVTLKKDHELIRTGPYGLVRHPIYTGLLLALLGTVVALGEWRGLIALAFFIGGFLLKLKREERFLGELFGAQYQRYRVEVPALIPRLGRAPPTIGNSP
jgi:protein-S-isoprenylcysteine O-methyltransferase Ste14